MNTLLRPHNERWTIERITRLGRGEVTQLRTNAVARWEYRPGSTVFLVWAHGRQDSENRDPGQSWTRDYRDLLELHPDNTFLIKVAYWLNR